MGDGQFGGASGDPIALLEQLLSHVAAVRRDQADLKVQFQELKGQFGELKAQFGELKEQFQELKGQFGELKGQFGELKGQFGELKGDMAEVKAELKSLRGDFGRFASGLDREQAGFKAEVEQVIDRKAMLGQYQLRDEYDSRWDRLERRIAQLEEAEARRKAGETA